MKYLIAITGFDRCGKDYVATKLVKIFKAKRVAFATPLKEVACDFLSMSLKEFDINKNEKQILEIRPRVDRLGKTMSYRNFIIDLSVNLRKNLGDKIFINKTIETLKNADEEVGVITDMRFQLEEKSIREFAVKNNVKLVVVRVKSDMFSCGENGIKYEVPNIKFDLEFKNNIDKEIFNRVFNCFVDKLSSRLTIPNPLKQVKKDSTLDYDYRTDKFIKVK